MVRRIRMSRSRGTKRWSMRSGHVEVTCSLRCIRKRGMIAGLKRMQPLSSMTGSFDTGEHISHGEQAMSRHALDILSLVLLAFLLAACGGSSDTRTEIVFWALGAEGERVTAMLPEFERRTPDIRVRVQMVPWNAAHEKLLTAFAGNSLPDISQLGNTWVPEFHVLNAIEELDPWLRTSHNVRETSYFPGIW